MDNNLVIGTIVELIFPVFRGNFRNSVWDRDVKCKAKIIDDIYAKDNKHWFTFQILECDDKEYKSGDKKRLQGKNAYLYCNILEQPENYYHVAKEKNCRKYHTLYGAII